MEPERQDSIRLDDPYIADYPDYSDENYDNYNTYNQLSREASYAIVKVEDLEGIRKDLISRCSNFTNLNEEDSTLVLIYFQWDIEKLQDNWYDDAEGYSIKSGIELSQSSLKKLKEIGVSNNANDNCLVCDTFLNKSDKKTCNSLRCNHFFCIDCWNDYLTTKLEDLLIILSVTCPQQFCTLVVPESFMFQILSPENRKILQKGIFINFTDNNKDMKWCPTPDCGICIRCNSHIEKEVECECKSVFCFQCGNEGHRPCPCVLVAAWDKKNNSESENVKWLIANTKQCPQCHKYIEKNQGCNHMTCLKQAGGCGYEFCWICMGEWKPHGSSYYQCNKFDPDKDKDKADKQQKAKFELEKYVFYFDRYINHHKAQKLSVIMRETIQNLIKSLNIVQMLPYEELTFLEKAVETIIKCRRILKYTYVFGFYMKDVPEKNLFEHHQFLLEKDADSLHEMMEDGRIEKMINVGNYEEFHKGWNLFKANVINLCSASTKFQENLLNEIETKMLEFVNYKSLKS